MKAPTPLLLSCFTVQTLLAPAAPCLLPPSRYAGTGAMKSAFTRTGKRDIWGLLDDGAKSLTR